MAEVVELGEEDEDEVGLGMVSNGRRVQRTHMDKVTIFHWRRKTLPWIYLCSSRPWNILLEALLRDLQNRPEVLDLAIRIHQALQSSRVSDHRHQRIHQQGQQTALARSGHPVGDGAVIGIQVHCQRKWTMIGIDGTPTYNRMRIVLPHQLK
jgi:hypothetical protein